MWAFSSWSDFIHMGHHGLYVWSAWLISLGAIAALIGHARLSRRRLGQNWQREQRRSRHRTQTPPSLDLQAAPIPPSSVSLPTEFEPKG